MLGRSLMMKASGVIVPPRNPDFANVSLLLHGNGVNGSTTIIDSSSTPKTVTAVGDAQISTARSRYGGSSITFDGNGDWLTVSDNSAFNFGTGDFTVETWIYISVGNRGNYVYDARETAIGQSHAFGVNTSNKLDFFAASPTFQRVASVASVPVGGWSHIAVTRSSGVISLFINGIKDSATLNFSNAINAAGATVRIGGVLDPLSLNGNLDELRITKNDPLYTQDFTPPLAPFPDF